jgi:hypothetical protein
MQNPVLIILVSVWIITNSTHFTAQAQPANAQLSKADSLFQLKRYTQSFELYQSLFNQSQYTPAMLLKMAYVEEGLNHIARSAYYLNLYYLATDDETAPKKLEELAQKYRLEGYETSESDRILALYHKNASTITWVLVSIIGFLSLVIVMQRIGYRQKSYAGWGFTLFVSLLFLAHLNFGGRITQGVIAKNNTYIMTGPSSGASVMAIVRDGHRITITGKKDVWLKVSWGEKIGYIRENQVLELVL